MDTEAMAPINKDTKIVIVGAGVFGLSTAKQLALEGHHDVLVLDRHTPPVPDGSSTDISRVVRFDYADEDYLSMAHEAYGRWAQSQKYKGIFFPADYLLAGTKKTRDTNWMDRTTAQLTKKGLKWSQLDSTASAKRAFPILSGDLASPKFTGYHHGSAGWVDASKAISQLRDECLELGVSMLFGLAGTVVGLETASGEIRGLQTASGNLVEGDTFVMSAGAWTSNLVQMYNSTLSTAQVVAYMKLTDSEMLKYKDLPIYMNFSTGWFNFPPHQDTQMLKMAVHGWGYTRALTNEEKEAGDTKASSSPPLGRRPERPNFVPSDGEERLRQGLREMLPELANRPFERVIMCWYTDSPSGDFIMDYHPDYENLFIAGAGSGHAFKFLPVLGEYVAKAIKKRLPENLAYKWRFRRDYHNRPDAFVGDGSRGGPARRELKQSERSALDRIPRAKL